MSSQAQKRKAKHNFVSNDCDKKYADGGFVEKYCISRQPFQLKNKYQSDRMTLDELLSSYGEHKIDQEYKAKFKDAENILQIKIKKDDFPDEEELNKIFFIKFIKKMKTN